MALEDVTVAAEEMLRGLEEAEVRRLTDLSGKGR
jgi:hypothetical protein